MAVKPPWSRLIRFVGADDEVYFGDALTDQLDFDVGAAATEDPISLHAKVVLGDPLSGRCKVTNRVEAVKRLLGPFTMTTMPAIRCIGGNYREHLHELDTPPPRYPIMFPKLPNAVAGYGDDVVIPKIAQDDQADYEIELAIVIGQDALNVSEEEAYDYVIGYMVANDVSSRKWQLSPELAGSQPQMSFSKSFNGFLPMGPCIVNAELIRDPQSLRLATRINGELRQNSNTQNMIFSVPQIIAHCSQGTTLQAGSVITTGTPSGVGYRMNPPQYLKPGDRVEMTIENVGTLVHGIAYA